MIGRYRNYSRSAAAVAAALDLAAWPLAPAFRHLAPGGDALDPPRSILVIRLDHLGDVLMSTPAIRALRRAYPRARLDVLAAPWGRAALEGNPDVDAVIEAPAPWYEPPRGEFPGPLDILPVSRRLRGRAYDWGFDLRGDPRVVLFYLLPAARRRFGFSRLGLETLLTDCRDYRRDRGMLDAALDLVALSGARSDDRRPVYRFSPDAAAAASSLLRGAGIGHERTYAVLAPGSNRAETRWGAGRFAALADGLAATGLRVVLVGRSEDGPESATVARLARSAPADLAGATSLPVLAAILARAAVLAANDSGAVHVAAAVDCPTVAVFGPTDPSRTFPYEDGRRFLSVSGPFDHPRPCFRQGCSSDHGLARVFPEAVLAACLQASGAAGRPETGGR